MKPTANKYTSIGGQAVLEGVMMRSPHFVAIAVRRPNQKIAIRHFPYKSLGERYPILRKPILRGVSTLLESMIQGIEALSYSASIAAEGEETVDGKEPEELSGLAIAGSIAFAFILGMLLFVALPHLLTVLLSSGASLGLTVDSPFFHLIDGVLKTCILLLYVYLIAMMKDIHRVFQYHGAEHKSIYAFEAGEELTVENAKKHTTLHPRCGTSFLLFLVLISIVVFSAVLPLLKLNHLFENTVLNHTAMVLVKIVLMFPVAGIAYEFIKLCACRMDRPIFRMLIWPGMILQHLTTREPDDQQLEIALASLKQVLKLEKAGEKDAAEAEIEISGLSDMGKVQATVAEFPEV